MTDVPVPLSLTCSVTARFDNFSKHEPQICTKFAVK